MIIIKRVDLLARSLTDDTKCIYILTHTNIKYDSSTFRGGGQSSFLQDLAFGATAGGIGSVVGTPAEICLVRMTADGRLMIFLIHFYEQNKFCFVC